MRAFDYVSAANTKQAAGLLSATWGQTEILAGGTDLLALMKAEIVAPHRLVNIKEIQELRGVTSTSQSLRIGSLTTLSELADDARIRQSHPALAEAIQEAASPQIRNTATLGGNLCQRPRCWYFRNGLGLLPRDEAGKDLVADGDNRYHAIMGNEGAAKFVSPSTIVPVLSRTGRRSAWRVRRASGSCPSRSFTWFPRRRASASTICGPTRFSPRFWSRPPTAGKQPIMRSARKPPLTGRWPWPR